MTDSMTITTRWNKLLPDWRDADTRRTGIVDFVRLPNTCFFSANAWGLKGKLPGGKHSWVSEFDGLSWKTFEITDIETIEVQKANVLYAASKDYQKRQLIVSDRDPSTMWFGNRPRLEAIHPWRGIGNECPFEDSYLLYNNCNTYVSYVAWRHKFKLILPYIGFKEYEYWEKNEAR